MHSLSAASKLYKDFKEIDQTAYHSIVHFYEAHQPELELLVFDTYFDVLVNYADALFEIGAYGKHIVEVDKVIELSIRHNIKFYKGEDIYFQSLFKKAASFYNTLELAKAEHILKELLKIAPNHGLTIRFLRKCLRRNQPPYFQKVRAVCIFLFLISALISASEVIIIRPFQSEFQATSEFLRIGTFLAGIILLAGTYLFHYAQVNKQVNQFLKEILL